MTVVQQAGRIRLQHRLRGVAWLLIVLCWLGVLVSVWARPGGYQWDFRTYYYAATAFDGGLNPYTLDSLMRVSEGQASPLRFVYPLSALDVVKPLTRFDYPTAARVWLALKVAALIGLLAVWSRVFLPNTNRLWIGAISLLGFQAATLWDLKTGNVSTFEQLLLWSGFAFLLRHRVGWFAVLVVAASIFKLTLSLFLLLLLLPALRSKRTVAVTVIAFAFLAGMTLASFAGHPDYLANFVAGAGHQPAWLQSNPSLLGVAAESARRFPGLSRLGPWFPYALAAVPAALLVYVGRHLILRAYRSESFHLTIAVACFAYALLLPRMMIYSYMLVIVPFLSLVLPAVKRMRIGPYALGAIVCLDGLQVFPSYIGHILDSSQPLLVLIACWFLLVYAERRNLLPTETKPLHREA